MADARHDEKARQGLEEIRRGNEKTADQAKRAAEAAAHNHEQLARATEKTADQGRQIGETAAQTSEQLARVGADLLQQNAEMLQNAMKLSVDLATAAMGRSTDQLSRTFGFSGEGVEQAAQRSTRNTVTLLQSGAAAAK